jgi:hypothetical protein
MSQNFIGKTPIPIFLKPNLTALSNVFVRALNHHYEIFPKTKDVLTHQLKRYFDASKSMA